jgi:hypothetical protein
MSIREQLSTLWENRIGASGFPELRGIETHRDESEESKKKL